MRSLILASTLFLAALIPAVAFAQDSQLVALRNGASEGRLDFSGLSDRPVTNDNGDVVFAASIREADGSFTAGLWFWDRATQTTTAIAKAGEPDLRGGMFSFFDAGGATLDNNGDVYFFSPQAGVFGLYKWDGTNLELVTAEGDVCPLDSQATLQSFSSGAPGPYSRAILGETSGELYFFLACTSAENFGWVRRTAQGAIAPVVTPGAPVLDPLGASLELADWRALKFTEPFLSTANGVFAFGTASCVGGGTCRPDGSLAANGVLRRDSGGWAVVSDSGRFTSAPAPADYAKDFFWPILSSNGTDSVYVAELYNYSDGNAPQLRGVIATIGGTEHAVVTQGDAVDTSGGAPAGTVTGPVDHLGTYTEAVQLFIDQSSRVFFNAQVDTGMATENWTFCWQAGSTPKPIHWPGRVATELDSMRVDTNLPVTLGPLDRLVMSDRGDVAIQTRPGNLSSFRDAVFRTMGTGCDLDFTLVAHNSMTIDGIDVDLGGVDLAGPRHQYANLNVPSGVLSNGNGGLDGRGLAYTPTGELLIKSPLAIILACGSDNCDPPVKANLVGLEVMQSAQDWNNSVPLIEDKPTIVRAHFQNDDPQRVTAQLRAYRGGVELPGSPLSPHSLGGFVMSHAELTPLVREFLAESLYWELPKSWLSGQVRLSVEEDGDVGIECRETAGPMPNDCEVGVEFLASPKMKVRFVELRTGEVDNIRAPRYGETWSYPQFNRILARQIRRMVADYPISEIEWTQTVAYVPFPNGTTYTSTTVRAYATVRSLRELKKLMDRERCGADCDTLYFGYLVPIENLRTGGLAAGIGGTRAMGMLDGPRGGRHSHEIGHLLGREHARYFTDKPEGDCGEVTSDGAPVFPYFQDFEYRYVEMMMPKMRTLHAAVLGPNAEADENAHVYNLDVLRPKVETRDAAFELMSYCHYRLGGIRTPSKETYERLRAAILAKWDTPRPAPGPSARYRRVSGARDPVTDTVEFERITVLDTFDPPASPPDGALTLELRDASGASVFSQTFAPVPPIADVLPGESDGEYSFPEAFTFAIPESVDFASAVVLRGAIELGAIAKSASPPTVQVVSPNGGEVWNTDEVTIQWQAADADGDAVTADVLYSPDGGTTWTPLALGLGDTELTVARSRLEGSNAALIRVESSDGFDVASDDSDATFIVEATPPSVFIDQPRDGFLYVGSREIPLDGYAPGVDPASTFAWSSSLDGALTTGTSTSVSATSLSEGSHTLTLTVTPPGGVPGTASVDVRVARAFPADVFDLELSGATAPNPVTSDGMLNHNLVIRNSGPTASPATTLTFQAPAEVTFTGLPSDCSDTGGGTVSCTIASLAAAAQLELQIVLQPNAQGQLGASASLTLESGDANHANNVLELSTLVSDDLGEPGAPDAGVGPGPDGGTGADAGARPDAGASPDTGSGEPEAEGCGCSTTVPVQFTSPWAWLVFLLMVRSARRRRRD